MSSYHEHREWLYRQYQSAPSHEQNLWVAEIDGHRSAFVSPINIVPYVERSLAARYTLGRNDGKTQLLLDRKDSHERQTSTV